MIFPRCSPTPSSYQPAVHDVTVAGGPAINYEVTFDLGSKTGSFKDVTNGVIG